MGSDSNRFDRLEEILMEGFSEEEILHHLNRNAPDAQERLNSLLKLSNSHGNTDNITAMILEF
jgi:serine/threonine protein phosphatase PrpC